MTDWDYEGQMSDDVVCIKPGKQPIRISVEGAPNLILFLKEPGMWSVLANRST